MPQNHKARCIQKLVRRLISWQRFEMVVAYKKKMQLELLMLEQQRQAANIIGYYYKRKLEKFELNARFKNRRWMIDEFNRLDAERVEAERVRDVAIEDKRRTDENMRATINASWKQGSDVNGRNYYYNYVTGESQWDCPEHFKVPVAINKWLKQLDDRQNVYYYNMQTQESSWLPPCTLCGDQSEKWCQECEPRTATSTTTSSTAWTKTQQTTTKSQNTSGHWCSTRRTCSSPERSTASSASAGLRSACA